MSEVEFWTRLGFTGDPFQFTNADEEESLQQYFVPPPYFDSVWGDPTKPVSQVIFAPRGGGKSAQRRMIERQSNRDNVFAITYDRFERLAGESLANLSTEYHLNNLIRLGLLGFLLEVNDRAIPGTAFRGMQRQQIQGLCNTYLGGIKKVDAMRAVSRLSTISNKAKKFLENWGEPISSLISVILRSKGLSGVNLKPGIDRGSGGEAPSKMHLEIVRDLLVTTGFRSVYVLVDKVDETPQTGNAENSFLLVKPLLCDLELLQIMGIGFKFFLWDKLEPHYREFARPDRVPKFSLSWTKEDLNKMLSLRLSSFSQGRVKDLSGLTDAELAEPLQEVVVLFASGSPRDSIRICQAIVREQLRLGPRSRKIDAPAIIEGITKFSSDRTLEFVDEDTLQDLKRVAQVDFTTIHLAKKVFRISVNAARDKVQQWIQMGIVEKIGEKNSEQKAVPATISRLAIFA